MGSPVEVQRSTKVIFFDGKFFCATDANENVLTQTFQFDCLHTRIVVVVSSANNCMANMSHSLNKLPTPLTSQSPTSSSCCVCVCRCLFRCLILMPYKLKHFISTRSQHVMAIKRLGAATYFVGFLSQYLSLCRHHHHNNYNRITHLIEIGNATELCCSNFVFLHFRNRNSLINWQFSSFIHRTVHTVPVLDRINIG